MAIPVTPLGLLIDYLSQDIDKKQIERLFSLVRVPPDVRFLRDGLERTITSGGYFQIEYERCRRGDSMAWTDMLSAAQRAIECIDNLQLDADDACLAIMQRKTADDLHPLYKHGMGVLHHWVCLFYSHDKQAKISAAMDGNPIFEELMAEFLAFVLAAQGHTKPSTYLAYCDTWVSTGRMPAKPLSRTQKLQSRLQVATRAMSRLTLHENYSLFANLSNQEYGELFSERVHSLLQQQLDRNSLLNDIALLIELLDPNWSRPGRVARDSTGGGGSPRTRRSSLPDGFVRLPYSDTVVQEVDDGDGELVELFAGATELSSILEEADDDMYPLAEALGGDPIEAISVQKLPPIGNYNYFSRLAQTHIQRASFGLPMSFRGVTKRELHGLAEIAGLDFGNQLEHWQMVALLIASLSTGRSLLESKQLHIQQHVECDKEVTEPHYDLESREWHIPVFAPAWKDKPVADWSEPIREVVNLTDYTGFHRFAHKLLNNDWSPESLSPNGLIAIGRIGSAKRRFLDDLLTKHCGDHISQNSVPRWLFHQLLTESNGDIAVASFLTGLKFSHSASASHYSAYAHEELQRLYEKATHPFSRFLPQPIQPAAETHKLRAGALRVPTVHHVENWLKRRQIAVTSAANHEIRHNNFVAHVIAALVLGIGMRPLTKLQFLNWSTSARLLTFDEKSRGDYHRRFNVVPEVILQQLEIYVEYWNLLQAQFPSGHSLYRSPFPILIDGEWQEMTPSLVGQAIGEPQMELYAFRRFARTQLLRNGATGEDVDGWMGHWSERTSPHDELSTYPMRRLMRLARQVVTPLLERVGFAVVDAPT